MIYERNTVWNGPGFLLKIAAPADDEGKPVVGFYDLNPDAEIRHRMSRSDMLKCACWFVVNAFKSCGRRAALSNAQGDA